MCHSPSEFSRFSLKDFPDNQFQNFKKIMIGSYNIVPPNNWNKCYSFRKFNIDRKESSPSWETDVFCDPRVYSRYIQYIEKIMVILM